LPFFKFIVSIKNFASESLISYFVCEVKNKVKNVKKISVAIVGLATMFLIYCFVAVSFFVSDKYTVIDGGNIDFSLPYFITSDSKNVLNAGTLGRLSDGEIASDTYKKDVELRLLGIIPVKTVEVNVTEKLRLIPSGECIGVKIFCDGLVTVGVTDFETEDGKTASPAKSAGIKKGDIIKEINGKRILKTSDFTNELDLTIGECEVTLVRDGKEKKLTLLPVKAKDGHKRIGVWVRDSVAGIGTLTFQKENDKSFAALGHGISDSDANILMPLENGRIYEASVLGINKGKKGVPGEIIGSINEEKEIGICTGNSETGIYGSSDGFINNNTAIEVASGAEIKKGEATVICTLDETGPKAYSIEITNINRFDAGGTKSMIIKVIDPRLISKTGGIVQGMSGSPIVQNGKLVGAVTHVFVNDPTRGYGIFIENMLAEAEKNSA